MCVCSDEQFPAESDPICPIAASRPLLPHSRTFLLLFAKADRYRIAELRYNLKSAAACGDPMLQANLVDLGLDILRYVLNDIMPTPLVTIAPDLLSLQCAAVSSWIIQVC